MSRISAINNNQSYKPNFKAIKIAKTSNMLKNYPTEIDIYKITSEDRAFINNLGRKINFSKLFPKLCDEMCSRWQQVFLYCLNHTFDSGNTTYVSVHNDKPCGIVTYKHDSPFFVDGICSIPTEVNRKVPGVGRTLFYQVFKDALNAKSNGIMLDAVVDGPFDAVNMYEQLGFKEDIPIEFFGYAPMSCNKYSIPKELKKLSEYINYEATDAQKTDLNEFLY